MTTKIILLRLYTKYEKAKRGGGSIVRRLIEAWKKLANLRFSHRSKNIQLTICNFILRSAITLRTYLNMYTVLDGLSACGAKTGAKSG